MVRPSLSSQDSAKSKYKELNIGEPFEIDYFYDTLANLRSDFQFKVSSFILFVFFYIILTFKFLRVDKKTHKNFYCFY